MSTRAAARRRGPRATPLLEIKDLRIEGFSDDNWHEIVKGIDLTLKRGEVLGLIGESGAGKSTIGLAAMGYAEPGCRISGGSIVFDGIDLLAAERRAAAASSGARASPMSPKAPPPPSTPPTASSTRRSRPRSRHSHRSARQGRSRTPSISTAGCSCPIPTRSASAIPTRSRAASCSAP